MAHTIESIENWINNYTFVSNSVTSKDIMKDIIRELPEHSYKFGPGESENYILEISGPVVNETFIIKTN